MIDKSQDPPVARQAEILGISRGSVYHLPRPTPPADPALMRRLRTSKPEPGHKIFPYLLRKVPVTQPNQVRAMDITCVPMAHGFVCLAAMIDWFSRKMARTRYAAARYISGPACPSTTGSSI